MNHYRSKSIATWIAFFGGTLGLHRFYLHGFGDKLGWLHPLPTAIGLLGVLRIRELGQDDHLAWLLVPLFGLMVAQAMLFAIVYGLTPDEKEVWVVDAANRKVHIFDNTTLPPKQVASIDLREQPGWVTFSVDGKYAYPSTGEVIDTKTRKTLLLLTDEEGREVHSEKIVEIHFRGGVPVLAGDQFGVGRKTK